MMEGHKDATEEKRRAPILTNAQLEQIAQRAAELVREDFYRQVGKGVITKALYLLGTGIVALAGWLALQGSIGGK